MKSSQTTSKGRFADNVASQSSSVPPRSSTIPRWRAATLLFVYILMAAHVVHWKISGKTLAPLELNEVMYTLELGIVTAGFVFMVALVFATAIFGRFFCSWGCHILALQDFSVWLLNKVGIKPRPIRSRMLLWVPAIAAAYMFLWPQVSRVMSGKPVAALHLATDADGWASFTTENYWRNLPGLGVAIATFFVCGFLVVYLLGSRSFCSYGCPYGAVFRLADRIAPGRIRVGPDCTQCATCTAVCTSHIRVHEEVERYGMVVDPACMKDLDCVVACPQQTLRYGFGRPSLIRRVLGTKDVKKIYDFVLWEELLAAVVFIGFLMTYRGLYDIVPFLLSLALAGILSYASIVLTRLFRQPNVSFSRWRLRQSGAWTASGIGFLACAVAVTAITFHSAVVHYSAYTGGQLYTQSTPATSVNAATADRAIGHLVRAQSWGLIQSDRVERMLGDLYAARGRWADAEFSLRKSLEKSPNDHHMQDQLGYLLSRQGRHEEARQRYIDAIDMTPDRAEPHYGLAVTEYQMGRPSIAVHHLRIALKLRPDYPEAHYELGAILVESGAPAEGIRHLRTCLQLKPEYGDAHYNLAVAFAIQGAFTDATAEIEAAVALQPEDERTQQFRAFLASLVRDRQR